MRLVVAIITAAVVAGTAGTRLSASLGPIPVKCDRACLEGVIDKVVAAIVAHDPAPLPLSADARYSENAQAVAVGDGFWKTAQGPGNYRHYFADPEAGQVAIMSTMREADTVLLLSLRVRVELGRITEIEAVLFRPGGGGPNNIAAMDKLGTPGAPDPLWLRSVPAAQRLSRQELIAIADGYFTSVQKNDGKGINGTGTYPVADDCHRIENGSPTTNVPNPKPETFSLFSLDCMSQFKMGYYYVVQNIHGRRFPLVDVERGVVWAHCVFDQGTVNSGVLADGTKHSYPGFNRPSSILVTEAFLIENAKIRRVEMIGPSATYHINSPWGGLSGS